MGIPEIESEDEEDLEEPKDDEVIEERVSIPTMTFLRATSGLRKTARRNPEETVDSSKKMPEMVEESTRPDRFLDEEHEKSWELEDCQKKIIIKVTREDFISEVKDYDPQVSDDFIFKNPVMYGARVSGIKIKIFNATGIMPHKLDI